MTQAADLQAPNVNHLWATLLVEELIRNGIDTFCVAPGSRSTPLVVAVARNDRARGIVHYDERGAAFHALGYGRVTGVPAAVITTSGSALANVWPAVVEASLERIPLLVLSGDRPPELAGRRRQPDHGPGQVLRRLRGMVGESPVSFLGGRSGGGAHHRGSGGEPLPRAGRRRRAHQLHVPRALGPHGARRRFRDVP